MRILTTLLFVSICYQSCDLLNDDPDDNLIYTEEFLTITVTITGRTLDDFYTIRHSTEEYDSIFTGECFILPKYVSYSG